MAKKNRGLYFEEFKMGDKFFSGNQTISELDIVKFAGISGDYNPIHVDEEFARTTLYGERIAHGLLGLAVVSGLAAKLGFAERTTIAFRGLDWKFRKPILIGDIISAVFEVIEKRSVPIEGAGLIVFLVSVSNQDKSIVQKGKWSLLIKKS